MEIPRMKCKLRVEMQWSTTKIMTIKEPILKMNRYCVLVRRSLTVGLWPNLVLIESLNLGLQNIWKKVAVRKTSIILTEPSLMLYKNDLQIRLKMAVILFWKMYRSY